MQLNLLKLLADGEYHSGADLGEKLGVSRAAVWKQIQKLAELSVVIESVKGLGYRIPGGLDLLSELEIFSSMDPVAGDCLQNFTLLQQVDSTNSYLLATPFGTGASVCLAEQQSAGRGRRGRTWVSPYGKNIYLSCTWTFESGVSALEGLSLAVGVALIKALEECGLSGLGLKWPNDVLWEGRKVAGILLEMTGDASGQCRVVVGIGMNVDMDVDSSSAIDQPWVNLQEIAAALSVNLVSRSVIVAKLLNHLLLLLEGYQAQSFSAWRDCWLQLDVFSGQEVSIFSGARESVGVARGVDESGALLLERDGVLERCCGGEISVRRRVAP